VNIHTSSLTCAQAWAFASGVRIVLGQAPMMNMDHFDHGVWKLHRRLFHRFVKYRKYFTHATEELPEFQQALEDEINNNGAPYPKKTTSNPTPSRTKTLHVSVMNVVSSSSEEVSEDENDGDDSEEEEEEEV